MNLQVVQPPPLNAPDLSKPLLTEEAVRNAKPLRRPWKISDGRGLYLMVVPTGGRYWRYNYRFRGRQRPFLWARFQTCRWRRRGSDTNERAACWLTGSILPRSG